MAPNQCTRRGEEGRRGGGEEGRRGGERRGRETEHTGDRNWQAGLDVLEQRAQQLLLAGMVEYLRVLDGFVISSLRQTSSVIEETRGDGLEETNTQTNEQMTILTIECFQEAATGRKHVHETCQYCV